MLSRLRLAAFGAALVLVSSVAHAQEPPPPPPDAAPPTAPTATPNRTLLLPDISLIGIMDGLFGNDKNQSGRNKWLFREGELSVQSFVYPGIKQDAFIVFGNGETGVEEAYLTVQQLAGHRLPLSAVFGRRKVPFGRVNQLHPHSWSWSESPAVLRNLLADESLTGDGAYLSYLAPIPGLFAQLDLGYFSQPEATPDAPEAPSGGASFQDRFSTARLWLSKQFANRSEAELGFSGARGRGIGYPVGAVTWQPENTITGADLTYRFGAKDINRTLLRGEWLQHEQKGQGQQSRTHGYYLYADQRLNTHRSLGLRYDNSGNPYLPGREKTVSLIATHQLTEQTYFRAQFISGERFGQRHINELRLQWTWGVGPHTHNLE